MLGPCWSANETVNYIPVDPEEKLCTKVAFDFTTRIAYWVTEMAMQWTTPSLFATYVTKLVGSTDHIEINNLYSKLTKCKLLKTEELSGIFRDYCSGIAKSSPVVLGNIRAASASSANHPTVSRYDGYLSRLF